MDQNALDVNEVVILDYHINRNAAKRNEYMFVAAGEIKKWLDQNVKGEYLIGTVNIDPNTVKGGDIELKFRRRRFERYYDMKGEPDQYRKVPDTIVRYKFVFADEVDAIMFKMRWVG